MALRKDVVAAVHDGHRTASEIARVVGSHRRGVSTHLSNAAARGEIRRVSSGIYAPADTPPPQRRRLDVATVPAEPTPTPTGWVCLSCGTALTSGMERRTSQRRVIAQLECELCGAVHVLHQSLELPDRRRTA